MSYVGLSGAKDEFSIRQEHLSARRMLFSISWLARVSGALKSDRGTSDVTGVSYSQTGTPLELEVLLYEAKSSQELGGF